MAVVRSNVQTDSNEEMTKDKNETSDDYNDVFCGIGSFRPPFLQPCAKITPFIIFVSITAVLTSALVIYISSQITTLERMFGFSSTTSGFIMSCNDMGYLLSILFASYFARRTHIPRTLSVCVMLYGIAGLICCIPYFVTREKFKLNTMGDLSTLDAESEEHLCQRNKTVFNITDMCEESVANTQSSSLFGLSADESTLAIALLSVGMVLQGFAKAPRSTYINTYVDDNVPKTKSAQYIGIAFGCAILGPAVAFGLGGLFSKIYITLEDSEMNYRDTRWLGAWWLGFLLFGAASMLSAIPLCFFPKHLLPKSQRLSVSKPSDDNPIKIKHFRGFSRALCRLIVNPVYFPLVICQITASFTAAGGAAFTAKYIETQFHVAVWKADIIMAGCMIIGGFAGTIIGGKIISYFKLSPTACMKLVTAFQTAFAILTIPFLVMGCPQQIIKEDTIPANSNYETMMNNSTCLDSCMCDSSFLLPVCDEETTTTYYSPCHAGCTVRNRTVFLNCTCVSTGQVSSGYCPTDCPMLIPFVAILFISTFVGACSILCFVILTMRCVSEEDKPLALGLGSFLTTLLGWMPAPILFGLLIDTTCIKWNSRCLKKGSCAVYDNEDFRYRYHGLSLGIRGFALFVQYYILWKIIRTNFFSKVNPPKAPEQIPLNETGDIALNEKPKAFEKDNGDKNAMH